MYFSLSVVLFIISIASAAQPRCVHLIRTASKIEQFIRFQSGLSIMPNIPRIYNISIINDGHTCKLKLNIHAKHTTHPFYFGYFYFKDSFSDTSGECSPIIDPLVYKLNELFKSSNYLKETCENLWSVRIDKSQIKSKFILQLQKNSFNFHIYIIFALIIIISFTFLIYSLLKYRLLMILRKRVKCPKFPTSHLFYKQPIYIDICTVEEGDRRSELSMTSPGRMGYVNAWLDNMTALKFVSIYIDQRLKATPVQSGISI